MAGVTGTMLDGIACDYIHDTGPDSYVDEISADEGTLLMRSQDGKGRAVCWEGAGGTYRALHSSVIFGALRDGTSTKRELMETYMGYLTGSTGVGESSGGLTPAGLALEYANPARGTVELTATVPGGEADISVYDLTGRLVGTIHGGQLRPGTHRFSWDGRADTGTRLPGGTYVVRLGTEQGSVTGTLLLI